MNYTTKVKTYDDLAACKSDKEIVEFIQAAISTYKSSQQYKVAMKAQAYYEQMNPTIMRYQKLLYDFAGRAVPDIYSANNKVPSNFYFLFNTQLVQFLLGNGVSFNDKGTKKKLNGADFDIVVQDILTDAQNAGVSFGFWNNDHLECFKIFGGDDPSFVPLYDENSGMLRAGIRYWQIDVNKPLRVTLYQEDGFTEYSKTQEDEELKIIQPKRGYVQIVERSEVGGEQVISDQNYPAFPIVPMYYINKKSAIRGNQFTIDAYDLMASKLVNNVSDADVIYWVLKSCGDMDEVDDAKFIEQLRRTHIAHAGEGDGSADAHTVQVPFEASEAALEMLRNQMYDDFMAFDAKVISGGATTATQIKAAYEKLNAKADKTETLVTRFILELLHLIGIDDVPSYTRSYIVNELETVQTITAAGENLSQKYKTQKILEVLGDIDRLEEVQAQLEEEDSKRMPFVTEETEEEAEEE